MDRRGAVARAALMSALLGTLLNLAVNLATGIFPRQWRLEWVSVPVIVVLLILLVLVEIRRTADAAAGPAYTETARADLAKAVAARWSDEAAYRSLDPPGPMTVTWVGAPVSVAAHEGVLWAGTAAIAGRRPRLPRVGSQQDIEDLYRRAPAGQLVIVGAPGSGKTALAVLLLRRLLQRQGPGEPVPVLVTLTEWDPAQEDLWSWFARRVGQDFPALRDRRRYGTEAAAGLVRERLVLPFLDGLDEMLPQRYAEAIAGVRAATATGHPFVLTCRTKEYESAVAAAGQVLPRAVVVQIQPVDGHDALTYLRHSSLPGDRRWQSVFSHIDQHPNAPMATVLSTPLMIWLAATAYASPHDDPQQMLDATRFPDRRAVEAHLLDAYLPAVYGGSPTRRGPRSRYRLDDASRWLRFLARHLSRRGSRDLLWWRLSDELPRWATVTTGLITGAICGGVGGVLMGLTNAVPFSLVLAAVVALPVGATIGVAGPPAHPAQVSRRHRSDAGATRQLAIGITAGAVTAVGMAPATGLGFAAFLLALGGLVGLGVAGVGTPDLLRATGPQSVFDDDASTLLGLTLLGLVTGILAGGFAFLADFTVPAWLGGGLAAALAGWFGGGVLLRPPRMIRGDLVGLTTRSAIGAAVGGVTLGALGAATATLATGPIRGDVSVLLAGAMFGLSFGLATGMTVTSWLWYGVTTTWLSTRGRLPPRLMSFLDDAHHRGVLRQAGAGYQFRHALLQDRLTEPDPADRSTQARTDDPSVASATNSIRRTSDR